MERQTADDEGRSCLALGGYRPFRGGDARALLREPTRRLGRSLRARATPGSDAHGRSGCAPTPACPFGCAARRRSRARLATDQAVWRRARVLFVPAIRDRPRGFGSRWLRKTSFTELVARAISSSFAPRARVLLLAPTTRRCNRFDERRRADPHGARDRLAATTRASTISRRTARKWADAATHRSFVDRGAGRASSRARTPTRSMARQDEPRACTPRSLASSPLGRAPGASRRVALRARRRRAARHRRRARAIGRSPRASCRSNSRASRPDANVRESPRSLRWPNSVAAELGEGCARAGPGGACTCVGLLVKSPAAPAS